MCNLLGFRGAGSWSVVGVNTNTNNTNKISIAPKSGTKTCNQKLFRRSTS